jgi:hypothetical protein
MKTTNMIPTHLRKRAKLTGQLQPGDGTSAEEPRFSLATEGGRSFLVKYHPRWLGTILRNVWAYVSIDGVIDYHDRTITISKFNLVGYGLRDLDDPSTMFESYYDPSDVIDISESIHRGKILHAVF